MSDLPWNRVRFLSFLFTPLCSLGLGCDCRNTGAPCNCPCSDSQHSTAPASPVQTETREAGQWGVGSRQDPPSPQNYGEPRCMQSDSTPAPECPFKRQTKLHAGYTPCFELGDGGGRGIFCPRTHLAAAGACIVKSDQEEDQSAPLPLSPDLINEPFISTLKESAIFCLLN